MNHSMYRKRTGGVTVSSTVHCSLFTVRSRRAFTLVELLVVVAIIGILATLITSAATAARQYVKVARIKMQLYQIEMAIEQYKNKYGEYPPDWSDQQAVLRHVKKRWPRFRFTTSTPADQYIEFCYLIYNSTGWNPRNGNAYTPEDMAFISTLPFWLGGLPNDARGIRYYPAASTPGYYYSDHNGDATGSAIISSTNPAWNNKEVVSLIGFSSNPENPFDVGPRINGTTVMARPSMEKPIMEFETGKNLAILVRDPAADNINGTRCRVMIFIDNGPVAYFKASQQEEYAYRVPPNANGTWRGAGNNGNWYANLTIAAGSGIGNDSDSRFKSLWTWDQYPNDKDGFAYRFVSVGNNLTRFYPGMVTPYLLRGNSRNATNNGNNVYFNSKTYQLIHPGLDEKFGGWIVGGNYGNAIDGGNGRSSNLTTGVDVTQFDMDNIVNFGEGTIKATLP